MSLEQLNGTFTEDGVSTVVNWTGRRKGHITAYGTFGSGTLSFQYSLDDGVTWKTVNSADAALAFTAAEFTADVLGLTFELPKCQVRFSLSDSTDPDIDYFIKSLAQA